MEIGSTPSLTAAIAMPEREWVCITTWCRSLWAMWTAEWMTKPAWFTPYGLSTSILFPSTSIFTRLEAVTSS